jgi:hypothetical protein
MAQLIDGAGAGDVVAPLFIVMNVPQDRPASFRAAHTVLRDVVSPARRRDPFAVNGLHDGLA